MRASMRCSALVGCSGIQVSAHDGPTAGCRGDIPPYGRDRRPVKLGGWIGQGDQPSQVAVLDRTEYLAHDLDVLLWSHCSSLDVWTSEHSAGQQSDWTEGPPAPGARGADEHNGEQESPPSDLAKREASPFNRIPAALSLIENAGAGELKHSDAAEREDSRDAVGGDQPGERHERHQRVRPEIAAPPEATHQHIPKSRAREPEMAGQEKHRAGPERDHHRLRARRAARTAARSGSRSAAGNSAPVARWRRTAPKGRSMTAKVICATASCVARPKNRRASSATASPSGWFRSASAWASRGERVSWRKSSRRNETSSLASSRCARAKS